VLARAALSTWKSKLHSFREEMRSNKCDFALASLMSARSALTKAEVEARHSGSATVRRTTANAVEKHMKLMQKWSGTCMIVRRGR
jgi:hypothetical protein